MKQTKNFSRKVINVVLSLLMVFSCFSGMSMTAYAMIHTHSFTYTANGDTITATCGNTDCDLTENKVTLKIVPNPVLYWNDGQPKEASLEGLETFNEATGKNISTDNIAYYKGDVNVTAQIKAGSGISIKAATYTARLDVEGVRAVATFKLNTKPVEHTHIFTYNAEGNVITATCTQSASNMEACDLENKQATLTLNAPLHATYGDGKEANATLTGEIPGVTNPTIHYSKGSVTLSSAPTDAGTYTAWCQLGNATARVEYTVAKAVNPGYTTLPHAVENLVYTGAAQELVTAGVTNTGQIAYTAGTDPDNEPDVNAGGMPYTYSVPKMTDAGTYYVWCKLDGGKNYTSLGAQKIAVTIAKANPTYSVPTGLTATYGDTLSSVVLPEGWTWADGTQSVGDVGTNIFKATFVPNDTTNYNTVTDVDVSVTVGKANPTYSVPTELTATYGDTLSSVVLPEGWTWADNTASVGNAGTNTFKANFTPTDTNNYNTVSNVNVSVTVGKANPTYTVPTGLTAAYGDTLSTVTLPEGWAWVDGSQKVGNAGTNTFKATFTPTDTDNYNVVENIDVTVTVLFDNGEVNTTLTVLAANSQGTTSPQTGDNSHMGLWIALMMLSLLGIAATLLFGRKKRVFDR